MLLRCIRAENRKLHGAPIWLVFLLVPAISCLYGTYNFLGNLGLLDFTWYNLWTQHTLFYSLFFFAPMVGMYAAYLWRLEHRGHNWNRIMAAPVPRFALFFAKFIAVTRLTLLTQVWVFALYLLCGKLWARLPGWPPAQIAVWLLRGVVGSFAIIALELLLAMVIRSFGVPVFCGLAGGISGMLAASRGLGYLWPFSLMQLGMNANRSEDLLAGGLGAFFISCALWCAALFGLAGLLLQRRDVKSEGGW